jgi:hypothetical protein
MLIRRIIAGLPSHLRSGGTFYSVCEAWDSREELFEERVRNWLGHQHSEFDILFALQREMSPEEVARQVIQLKHADKDAQTINWLQRFRDAALVRRVYGAIVIHRRATKNHIIEPFTRRLRLGVATDSSSFEWALSWYDWCRRNQAHGELEHRVCNMKPRLSPRLKAKVTHTVQNGSLMPADVVLEVDKPFPTASRVDFWMMQMLAGFDGQLTTAHVYNAAREQLPVPDSFGLKDFISLVARMIERGCLEVDHRWLAT